MTLDALDQAFVARWAGCLAAGRPTTPADPPPLSTAGGPAASGAADRPASAVGEPRGGRTPAAKELADPPATAADTTSTTAFPAANPTLVKRLLAVGRDQWATLAAEVEAARFAGHRVIAVTGGDRGEGRTMLVACLAAVLRDRGRDVIVRGSTAELATGEAAPADGGRLHDKRIVLVDAGVWFPAGPIRRHRLLIASLGCDAAILVRRADREPVAARAAALAAVGVVPLGEVVTFAAASPAPTGGC